MVESYIKKDNTRVRFPKGMQSIFLYNVLKHMNISQRKLSQIISINPRTVSDWLREKNTISFSTLNTICKYSRLSLPKNIQLIDKYWYTKIGGPLGGEALYKKHGGVVVDEEYRKKKWREWWNIEGKKRQLHIGKTKECKIPKLSASLAEFIGIMIGDGSISTYQCQITLNSETDYEYSLYVEKLVFKLFKIKISRYLRSETKALVLRFSRKKIVDFLITIGLKKGHKIRQKVDIPSWIKSNLEYQKACLRGLVDTDGSLFHENHKMKGKKHTYPRLSFVTSSPYLASSVMEIFELLNLSPNLRRMGQTVQLENKLKICDYFKIIGTSNPKHLYQWKKDSIDIQQEESHSGLVHPS